MNRKLRLFSVFILAALLTAFILPVAIQATADEPLPRFADHVGLLSREQAEALTEKLDEISIRNRFDTVIAVVRSLDYRDAQLYAADYFEQNGYGFGEDIDGCILLLAMESRDFGFSSFGFGLRVFTQSGQEYLDELILPDLKNDRYFEAFMAFADAVDDFVSKAESGEPYDEGNIPQSAAETMKYRLYGGIIAIVLALIIALIVTGIWRRQLISVRKENLAHEYIRNDSMVLTDQRDIFLHRHVQKIRRAESSGSSRGGGSSRSSSGRRSTGHRGKF